jgi:transcriptional regulator with XRE-family HTH domain
MLSEFAERLKQTRKNKKISQSKIAEKIGVHLSTYSNYDRGKQAPDIGVLVKICKILEVTPNWLIYGSETAKQKINIELLAFIIAKIEELIKNNGYDVDPLKKSKIISYLYADFCNLKGDEDIIKSDKLEQLLKMVI